MLVSYLCTFCSLSLYFTTEPDTASRVSSTGQGSTKASPRGVSPSSSSISLDSGSTHSIVSSDVSLPSVAGTPPPVPTRAKAPPPPPVEHAEPSPPPQPAPSKKGPAPQPQPQPPPPAPAPANPEPTEAEWPSAPPPVSFTPPGSPTKSEAVPMTTGAELIELVRKNTGLSYELSRVAVAVVVGHLQSTIPQAASDLEQVLLSLVESKVSSLMSKKS